MKKYNTLFYASCSAIHANAQALSAVHTRLIQLCSLSKLSKKERFPLQYIDLSVSSIYKAHTVLSGLKSHYIKVVLLHTDIAHSGIYLTLEYDISLLCIAGGKCINYNYRVQLNFQKHNIFVRQICD